MNIAYLSGALRVSTRRNAATLGPRSHILGWIRGASALGHRVYPLIAGDLIQRSSDAPDSLVRGRAPKRLLADSVRLLGNRAMQVTALGRFAGKDLDIVYERHGAFQAVGRPLTHAKSLPWILESNGLFFREAAVDRQSLALVRLARRSELSAYCSATLVVCVSPLLADEILRETRGGARTVVVPNGVDTEIFQPAGGSWDAASRSDVHVGYVGSIVDWQNLVRLVRVVSADSSLRHRLRLTIVGDGPGLTAVRAALDSCAIKPRVTFTGRIPLEAVPAAINDFDICYSGHLPTLAGGMYHSPLKTYEYLAMGKPVIASDHPESRAMSCQVPGISLFDATSDSSLHSALLKVVGTEDIAAGSSQRREWVVQHHSWQRRVDDLLRVI